MWSQSRKLRPGPGHSWIQVGTGQPSLLAFNGSLGQDFKYFDLPVLSSSICNSGGERERGEGGGGEAGTGYIFILCCSPWTWLTLSKSFARQVLSKTEIITPLPLPASLVCVDDIAL